MHQHEAILEYWFGALTENDILNRDSEAYRRWFGQSADVDREIRARFGSLVEAAERRELAGWTLSAKGRLALVLLVDQFPRHVYRGTARAFATDDLALDVALQGITAGHDAELALFERVFLFMPLQHAEQAECHVQAERLYASLVELAHARAPNNLAFYQMAFAEERRHAEVVRRFGRYPHRNAVLGRHSTPEELAFLEQPGSSF